MAKKMDLCGKCAALLRESHDIRRVAGGADNKITCSNCGRRRYGATYDMQKKDKSKAKA